MTDINDTIARNAVLFDRQRNNLRQLKEVCENIITGVDEALDTPDEFDLEEQFGKVLLAVIPAIGFNELMKKVTETMTESGEFLRDQRGRTS